jgi:glycosyltransferase involved in cell wall biosynthesis
MKSICFITNIPAPYREKIHELVSTNFGGQYTVIYLKETEPNRIWRFKLGGYKRVLLKGLIFTYKGRYIHINPGILRVLNKLNPDIVITNGFNPTFLLAFFWALLKKRKHITFIDGWLGSEKGLSAMHRLVRRVVFKYTKAFIGPSLHTKDLYLKYRCNSAAIFQSHLCANNELFFTHENSIKEFDIMFSGQIIPGKMPLFFADVAGLVKRKRGKCKALIIGDGPLKEDLFKKLSDFEVEFKYPGFIQQELLPAYYKLTRLFLFPTICEAWGIVANEACAAGVPVITCENAGVAGDLIINNFNGYVLPLDENTWAEKIIHLLNNEKLLEQFSQNAIEKVKEYNFSAAAQGIVDAINYTITT